MKTVFIFLMTAVLNLSMFAYEYNFADSYAQKGLFINSQPYSIKTEICLNNIVLNTNYILVDNKTLVYLHETNLIANDCVNEAVVLKKFDSQIKAQVVFKNRLYVNVNDEVWVSDGTINGTALLKTNLAYLSFNTTNYSLYILEYPAADVLNIYTTSDDNKSLKKVLRGVSTSTSRFAHFGTPFLYITRWGNLFKMNEITHEVETINEQPLVYYPSVLAPMGGKLLHFISEKGEIFITDGTKEGTKIIKSFRDTKKDYYFKVESVSATKITFLAAENDTKMFLYETDGTTEGTVLLKEVANSLSVKVE